MNALGRDRAGGFAAAPHRRHPLLQQESAGGTLSPLRLVVIVASGDPLAEDLYGFGDAAVASDWFKAVTAEYGVAAPLPSAVHLVGGKLPSGAALDDDAVAAYIELTLASTTDAPTPDGRTLYLVYLPPGVELANNASCRGPGSAGYHHRYGTGGDGFAVIQRCQGGFESLLQMLTIFGSHEIAEAVTDSGAGWRLPSPSSSVPIWMSNPWLEYEESRITENGDLCIDTRVLEGGYWYQRSFSNAAALAGGDPCVPSLPMAYYGATTEKPWYTGAAGTTLQIVVTGWSTAPADDWSVRAHVQETSAGSGAWAAATTSGAKLNNGTGTTLTVKIPEDAPSGAWASIFLLAAHEDDHHHVLPGEDYAHLQMVGVYVP